jgi:hypothetical protein
MSDTPTYHEEIDRICDLAVAVENSRLAEGGIGVGDKLEGIKHEGRRYGVRPQELEPIPVQRVEPEPDNYRGLIEAEPQATQPDFQADTERRLDEIRSRVMGYDRHIREDIGFLLTVIDASR